MAAGGDDEQVEWMFKPPEGLSCPTSFADTRAMCKQVSGRKA